MEPGTLVRLHLGLLIGLLGAILALLVIFVLFLAPGPLMGRIGVWCIHTDLCPHGLPLWSQFLFWVAPLLVLGWLIVRVASTTWSHLAPGRRARRLVRLYGHRLKTTGDYPVYEVKDTRLIACTVGILRPLVYVSTGLREALAPEEFEAVLAHEQAHASGRHNLVLLASHAAANALFFVPGTRHSLLAIRRAVEISADADATKRIGDALSVAGALTRVATLLVEPTRGERVTPSVADALASFVPEGSVVERVERLICDGRSESSRARLFAGIAALLLVFLVFCSSSYALGTTSLGGADQAILCTGSTDSSAR